MYMHDLRVYVIYLPLAPSTHSPCALLQIFHSQSVKMLSIMVSCCRFPFDPVDCIRICSWRNASRYTLFCSITQLTAYVD